MLYNFYMKVILAKSTQCDVRTHLLKLQDRKIPPSENCQLEFQANFTLVEI